MIAGGIITGGLGIGLGATTHLIPNAFNLSLRYSPTRPPDGGGSGGGSVNITRHTKPLFVPNNYQTQDDSLAGIDISFSVIFYGERVDHSMHMTNNSKASVAVVSQLQVDKLHTFVSVYDITHTPGNILITNFKTNTLLG